MLQCLNGKGHIYATDVDPEESAKTKKRLAEQGFGEDMLTVKLQNFCTIDEIAKEVGGFDFILADLGVSSMQIDNPKRGFSFKVDGPLDLRLNQEAGISAAERLDTISAEMNLPECSTRILMSHTVKSLPKRLLMRFAEEIVLIQPQNCGRSSRKHWIFCRKKKRKIRSRRPARESFQALRIDVNREFEVLYEFMEKLPDALRPGGRVAILTFHSGEDKLVKKGSQRGIQSRNLF